MVERCLAIGNDREEFFELTTPLFISEDRVYSLMVPGYKAQRVTSHDSPPLHFVNDTYVTEFVSM